MDRTGGTQRPSSRAGSFEGSNESLCVHKEGEFLGQPSSLLTNMLYCAGVRRVFRTVKVQKYEMSKSGPLSPWFNPRAWEWNLIPRCLRRWAEETALYQEERDNKNDVDKKLGLEIYNKCQPVYSCLSHVTFAHGSVAVLDNNCQNIFNSPHTWASWYRLRKL